MWVSGFVSQYLYLNLKKVAFFSFSVRMACGLLLSPSSHILKTYRKSCAHFLLCIFTVGKEYNKIQDHEENICFCKACFYVVLGDFVNKRQCSVMYLICLNLLWYNFFWLKSSNSQIFLVQTFKWSFNNVFKKKQKGCIQRTCTSEFSISYGIQRERQ